MTFKSKGIFKGENVKNTLYFINAVIIQPIKFIIERGGHGYGALPYP